MSKYKLLVAREQIMVAKTSPWRLGNVQLVLIVAVVKVYLQKDSFHFKLNKYQQDKKYDTCWQIASRFQFLIIFSERESLHYDNQLYKSPAGDQLWNSGCQNWIFGRIGDQEGTISDPEYDCEETYLACKFCFPISDHVMLPQRTFFFQISSHARASTSLSMYA